MIATVGALSIVTIWSMTYEEKIQTDELELVSLADNSETYEQKELFYIYIILTNRSIVIKYKVNNNERGIFDEKK